MHIHLLLLFLITLPVHATVFQKQPIGQQIKEADGIVQGHFLRKKYIKLDNGNIATQMIFKMNKETGMQSELFGMDEIIIHYPGGKWDNQMVKVEGVPDFVPGEHVILMVKSMEDRYWGMNLAFGTFRIVNYGKEKRIVNSVFPDDRSVGQISLEEFEKQVKSIRGLGMKVVMNPEYHGEIVNKTQRAPASVQELEGQNRAIASDSEEEENNNGHGVSPTWLIFILAVMGGIFRLTRQREVK